MSSAPAAPALPDYLSEEIFQNPEKREFPPFDVARLLSTVFAPTDEAFAALPEGALEDLLKPENKDRLNDVLTYHVVPGRLFAADLIQQQSATAANGKDLQVGLTINQATLKQADITAANGIIHVIDSVLLPA